MNELHHRSIEREEEKERLEFDRKEAAAAAGVGTTFHIYLPVSEEAMRQSGLPERAPSGKGKVLVMDDEEAVRDVIGEMLRNIGFDVEFAADGSEAIELFIKARNSGYPFDVVILDLVIPGGLGGKKVIRKLLEIDPDAKAIVCSGYSDDPVMTESEKYGFRGVLAKPFKIGELRTTLSKIRETPRYR